MYRITTTKNIRGVLFESAYRIDRSKRPDKVSSNKIVTVDLYNICTCVYINVFFTLAIYTW